MRASRWWTPFSPGETSWTTTWRIRRERTSAGGWGGRTRREPRIDVHWISPGRSRSADSSSGGCASSLGEIMTLAPRARAAAVHLYTASGAVLAFAATAEVGAAHPDPRRVFLLL